MNAAYYSKDLHCLQLLLDQNPTSNTNLPGGRFDVDGAPPGGQCALHSHKEVPLARLFCPWLLTQTWKQHDTVNVGNSQKFVSLQENLLSTKNILKIQRTAELRKDTQTGFAESLWPQTNRTNTH